MDGSPEVARVFIVEGNHFAILVKGADIEAVVLADGVDGDSVTAVYLVDEVASGVVGVLTGASVQCFHGGSSFRFVLPYRGNYRIPYFRQYVNRKIEEFNKKFQVLYYLQKYEECGTL